MEFDYEKEPHRDILCIDCMSFYASVECVSLGLHPLETLLVVMSHAENAGGLVLASSPLAKKVLGVTNVTRKKDVPYHPELHTVPPRMNLYMEKNYQINEIYKQFVPPEDHHVYSVDESFLDITASINYFKCQSAYELARLIQERVQKETGIFTTIGIGDNMLLAKLALDNGAKHSEDRIAEWRYEDVPEKVWRISPMTDFWGLGGRSAKRLERMKISTIYELAHANYADLKQEFGIIGEQLYAHAWGIDRSFLGDSYKPTEKSISNSQVLPRNYSKRVELEIVLSELADQVATRLRRANCQTSCVSLWAGYASGYRDSKGKGGFQGQIKITATNNTRVLKSYVLHLFNKFYRNQVIRTVGVTYSQLVYSMDVQLDLFHEPEEIEKGIQLDYLVDAVRKKYGFESIIHATSLLEGGTAVQRSVNYSTLNAEHNVQYI